MATALVEQRAVGGSLDVRMSLARVAQALLASPVPPPQTSDVGSVPTRQRVLSGAGVRRLTYAPPVLAFAGAPDDYVHVGGEWGADAPEWASATHG
jgi:hypothetical protein